MAADEQGQIVIREPKDAPKNPIQWESVTEQELADRAKVFSFELSIMRRRLGVNSNWAKIIVAHIYADHILTQTLIENLHKPSAIEVKGRRKYLLDKLEMCEAMGWVDPTDATILKKLNSLRNRFAHTLSFSVTANDVSGLRDAMPKEYCQLAEEKRNGKPSLKDYLAILLVFMDIKRQNVLKQRYLERLRQRELHKAMLNARAVLSQFRDGEAQLGKRR